LTDLLFILQVHHPRCVYIYQKKEGELCLNTQLSWICIFIVEIRLNVSALLGHLQVALSWTKEKSIHNRLYTGVM
jgi:hypothetical protein